MASLDQEPLTGEGSGWRLARARAAAVDRAVTKLFAGAERGGMALAGVGGYGSGQLAPGSDIDLVLLCAADRREESQAAFERLLYPLWDAGFRLGHALRTLEEFEADAKADVFTLTSALSIRWLEGSKPLVRAVGARARALVQETDFLGNLRATRIEREARAGRVAESQAPDLRDGLGGLRDLQLIDWIEVRAPDEGPKAGPLRRPDFSPERELGDFLWRVRIALHRVTGGASNALGPDEQAAVAEALGIGDEPGWTAPDRLMRRIHWTGAVLDWAAETELHRAARAVGMAAPEPIAFERPWTPERWVGAFAELAEHGGWVVLPPPPRWLRRPTDPLPWSPDMVDGLLRILASGAGGASALEVMNVVGFLRRLVPEWDGVDGRPQRDPYHRYPVGVHLIQAAAHTATLLHRPDEPFAVEAAAQVSAPAPLLLGAFLHDIGKVGRGSHVAAGAEIAARVLDRVGVDEATRDSVLFLVREHLLLSDTATRRNLDDEDLILHVAARIGDPGRLAMLYLLTVADAAATGPAASTPWRLGLIRELVAKVSRTFERGDMDRDRAGRLERAEAEIRTALAGEPQERVDAFVGSAPPAYLLWVEPSDAPAHLRLVDPKPGSTEVRTHVRPGSAPATHLLAVGALDRPGLLSRIAGALTLSGLSVLQARAFTTELGVALDVFEVGPAFEEQVGEERWRRFRTTLRHAMEGRIDVRDRIDRLRAHYRPARADIPVTVKV
ncbi:MAG TPA: ACT domain-containing protein, partial [Actinomycetota bacterium]